MSLTKFGKKLLCFLALIAFGFAIVACTNNPATEPSEAKQTAEEHVENIYNKIFWDSSAMEDISSNIVLITNTMYEDTKVVWSSDHPDIISNEGVVTRPAYEHEEAVSVNPNDPEETAKHVAVRLRATITATYEEDGKQKEAIKYKEFVFTVLTLAEGLKMTSIAEAKAAAYQYIYEEMGVEKALVSNPNVVYNVGVYGKVTAKLNAAGAGQFMIHDGTEGIYVYSAQADLQVGDTVSVVGGVYSYYGNLQIAKDVTVTKVEREIEVPAHTEISIDAWEKSVADLSQIGYHGGKLYKLYAKLEKVEANVAKDVFKLTDPYTAEVAWIYYKSYSAEQEAILDQYNGKYVNITGVTYDRDSRLLKNHLMWDGGIEEAEAPTLSDEQKLGQVVASVEALAGSYVSGSLLALPTADEEYGATITWTIPEGAPYANGAFSLVDADVEFVATAVVTVNGKEQTVEVKFTVNPIKTVTVAQAIALEVGSTVKLSGTIDVTFGKYANYYLKDASGSLLVYVGTSNGIEVNGETVTVKPGDKVTFIGKTAVFNGCPQIGSIVSYEAHEAGEWQMSMPEEVSVADIKAYTVENAPYGKYLMVKGNLVKSGNYYFLADGEQQISLYNSTVGEKLAAVADTDTQVTLFVYFYGFQKTDYSGDTRVVFAGRDGEFFIGDEEVILPTERTYKTIEEAKALATADGVELTVRGVVTHVGIYSDNYGNFGALIADATGGLYLYRVAGTDAYKKLVVGDEVELKGLMKVYNGLFELCNVSAEDITVISSGNSVEVGQMSNDLADQSKVVELNGAKWNGSAFEKDGQTYAYFYSSSWLAESPSLVAGYTYNVKGWVNWYNAPQITPIETPVVVSADHTHVLCPECGKCTAPGCDGEVCPGHSSLPTEGVVTLAQAVEIASKQAHNTYTTGKFTVTGTVNDLYNTTYGNMHLIDADGNDLTIYGLYIEGSKYGDYSGTKPVEGDVITVTGVLGTYNGTPQMKNAALVIEVEHVHVLCPECGKCTAAGCDGEVCPGHIAANETKVSVSIADYAAANGWADATMYNDLVVDANVSIKMSAVAGSGSYGANSGKYYVKDYTWRFYQSDTEPTIVVTGGEGVNIVSIKFTYTAKNTGILVANGANYESDAVISVNASTITITIGNTGTKTNGQALVTAIEVVYTGGKPVEPNPEPTHEHVACPECGKCTAEDCDGAEEEKCAGHEAAPTIETITIAEFLTKADDKNTWYQLTGVVSNIANTTYGNFTLVDQNDSSVSIYVYGLTATQVSSNDKSFASLGLQEGYILTLIGTHSSYNGDPQVGGPAYYVSHEVVEVVTPSNEVKYTFADYAAGVQYAENEVHVLDEITTVTTNGAHFTSQIRLYDSSSNDGIAVFACAKTIEQVVINAGNKAATLEVYASVDGVEWTLVSSLTTTSAYGNHTVELGAAAGYKYIKLDAVGAQVRVAFTTFTFAE